MGGSCEDDWVLIPTAKVRCPTERKLVFKPLLPEQGHSAGRHVMNPRYLQLGRCRGCWERARLTAVRRASQRPSPNIVARRGDLLTVDGHGKAPLASNNNGLVGVSVM
jgi:hypothetical protein